jgi:hypothetical protein
MGAAWRIQWIDVYCGKSLEFSLFSVLSLIDLSQWSVGDGGHCGGFAGFFAPTTLDFVTTGNDELTYKTSCYS